jgi:hypothetical protein
MESTSACTSRRRTAERRRCPRAGQDNLVAVRRGTLRAPTAATVADAADALIVGMADGTILSRSRAPFRASTRRSYEQALRGYVVPDGVIALAMAAERASQDTYAPKFLGFA